MNLYDPSAEQPTYKKSLIDALTGVDPSATAPKIGGVEQPTGTASDVPAPVAAAPTWSKGVNANSGMILGFDTNKLNDPTYHSAKYTNAAKAFSDALKNDVGLTRGADNTNFLNFLNDPAERAKVGLPAGTQAKFTSDDKVDFGDGQAPVDIFGSDGSIRFQNTPQGPAATSEPAGSGLFAGSGINPMLQSNGTSNIDAALQNIGSLGQSNLLQQLIAQLQGGR